VNRSLAGVRTDGLVLPQRLLEHRAGLADAARPGVAGTDAVQAVRLPGSVAGPAGGGQAGPACRLQLCPEPTPQLVGSQHPGELPGGHAGVARGGTVNGGQQRGVLGGEPSQRVIGSGQLGHGDSRLRRGQVQRVKIGHHQRQSTVPGVQVMVKNPVAGRRPGGVRHQRVHLFGGVGAQQIVSGIPARAVLGEQVRVPTRSSSWAGTGSEPGGFRFASKESGVRVPLAPREPTDQTYFTITYLTSMSSCDVKGSLMRCLWCLSWFFGRSSS
jgi:hypothetical protein